MTASRYLRATQGKKLDAHADRIDALEFGTPLATFRASITGNFFPSGSISTLREYGSLDKFGAVGIDTVFWDYWENGSPEIFQEFVQPDGHPDVGRLGAVELIPFGTYIIRATIDWDDFFDGHHYLGSNYDDGGVDHWYSEGAWDTSLMTTINHTRLWWGGSTGAENSVEIVAGFVDINDMNALRTIPGGFAGAWAQVPHLIIHYMGGFATRNDYFQEVT